ncbi:hypothetical protein HKX48_009306 [Thoreauomyces humboldtii]|nr:hypothetical protein HKX48_009306 [Thoreauomyces humboldtii]
MVGTRTAAHDWSGEFLQESGEFRDAHGRVLQVRGVNLSGNSKLPTSPPGSTHLSKDFFEHTRVSYIGRPFPLAEANEHFGRLRSWGLTFLRLLVPWEALEHEGPGLYDDAFIDYLREILGSAATYGIKCFIDPHQDTWSRFSGGSGAPGWTFEVVGLDITRFMQTGAAYVHQSAQPEDSGHTAWPTNYQKLASSTMFTVFFGGQIFAPHATYKGEHPQEYLQRHFCNAFQHLASRLTGLAAVVGFEVINEPHPGYIALPSVHSFDPLKDLHYGPVPSALQSMALGSGIPQEIDVWVKSWPWPTRKDSKRVFNVEKVSAWLPGRECIWKTHGVWDIDEEGNPRAVDPAYFSKKRDGSPVNFYHDCYIPFIKRYTEAITAADSSLLIFFEPIPNEDPPTLTLEEDHKQLVYSPHWYDLKVLFNKAFNSMVTHDVQGLSRGTKNVLNATYFGAAGAKKNYRGQIRNIVRTGRERLPGKVILVGECGLPMDINEKQAFETGDYTQHTIFLDAMISAMEESLVNFTLWNYNPHNDNMWGDHWNGEDFSIYSPSASRPASRPTSRPGSRMSMSDTQSAAESTANPLALRVDVPAKKTLGGPAANIPLSPTSPMTPFDLTEAHFDEGNVDHPHHTGGRALDAVIRPYAAKIPGTPILTRFDLETLEYICSFAFPIKPGPASASVLTRTAEIFVPTYHYRDLDGLVVETSDGTWTYDRETQTLAWTIDAGYTGPARGDGGWLSRIIGDPQQVPGHVVHQIKIRPKSPRVGKSWLGSLLDKIV